MGGRTERILYILTKIKRGDNLVTLREMEFEYGISYKTFDRLAKVFIGCKEVFLVKNYKTSKSFEVYFV